MSTPSNQGHIGTIVSTTDDHLHDTGKRAQWPNSNSTFIARNLCVGVDSEAQQTKT